MIHFILITQGILEALIVVLVYAFILFVLYFVQKRLCIYYKSWRTKRHIRQMEKDYEEFLQRQHKRKIERELLRKEQQKYPLFYWRESCRKDSDQRETCKKEKK